MNPVGLSTGLIVSAPVVESETPAPALGISAPGSCVRPGLMELFTANGVALLISLDCKSGLTWSISTDQLGSCFVRGSRVLAPSGGVWPLLCVSTGQTQLMDVFWGSWFCFCCSAWWNKSGGICFLWLWLVSFSAGSLGARASPRKSQKEQSGDG